MSTEIPLIIHGHLFTCVQVATSAHSILPPKLAGCGCNNFLSPEPNLPLVQQEQTNVGLYNRLDIQSPNSPQPAPRNTSTAPPTPTKKNKSSVGPVRTPKRKFANAVNSSNFAVCMVSPEQAARAAGERRRGKATFGSPRSRKRARSDDEVQSPRSTRQRTLRKRAAHTEAASTMQSIGAEPTSIRDLAPILPEQRVEEPQALVALNQVEASLQYFDHNDFLRLWEAMCSVSAQPW